MALSVAQSNLPSSLADCTVQDLIKLLRTDVAFNDNKINSFKDNIIQYLQINQIDGLTLSSTPRKEFSQALIIHCNGNKRIRGPANKLWDRLHKYIFQSRQPSVLIPSNKPQSNSMNWRMISECVDHELYPRLANSINTIIEDNNEYKISNTDFNEGTINQMINILKDKQLPTEEQNYLKQLCHRAKLYNPLKTTLVITEQANKDEDNPYKDLHENYPGLSPQLLRDVFDVHRIFMFTNYHFAKYSLQQFNQNLDTNTMKYVTDHSVRQQLINNNKVNDRFNLFPQYIIHDDIFAIFGHIFKITEIVHHWSKNKPTDSGIKVLIRPELIKSVYGDHIYEHNIAKFYNYLDLKEVYDYQRNTYLNTDYLNECVVDNDIKYLIIIIDRAIPRQENIFYIFPCDSFDHFNEFNIDYLFGFDFIISNKIVTSYLRYGVNEYTRFYPEFLTSLIPRYFKRDRNISEYKFLKKLYANDYKHGWSVALDDKYFNKYYKMITEYDHVSVNYNRKFLKEKLPRFDACISSKVQQKKCECNEDTVYAANHCEHIDNICSGLKKFKENDFSVNTETKYEWDLDYLLKLLAAFDHLIDVHQYSRNRKFEAEDPECNDIVKFITESIGQCEFGNDCVALKQHIARRRECEMQPKALNDVMEVKEEKYDAEDDECKTDLIETIKAMDLGKHSQYKDAIITWMINDNMDVDKISEMGRAEFGNKMVKICDGNKKVRGGLQKIHKKIKRIDTTAKNIARKEADIKRYHKEILLATLNALHAHIMHKKELFRLRRSKIGYAFLPFISSKEERSKEKGESSNTIKFGVNILKWLKYDEKPLFNSLREEMIQNPTQLMDVNIFESFKEDCKLKLSLTKIKEAQYQMDELLSLKIYTDTTHFQSEFRKGFWDTSSLKIKQTFWNWGMALYKTILFHSKPIPKRPGFKNPYAIHHGLSDVFVIEDGLPCYHGPISTTFKQSVANKFSQGAGLVWTVQANYENKFRFITGMDMQQISGFPEESEVLLFNQCIPISKTRGFDNDVNNNVNHLLQSILQYQTLIIDAESFCDIIGLDYEDKNHWMSIITADQTLSKLLYKQSQYESRLLLQRIWEELEMKIYPDQYQAIKSKFSMELFPAFNHFSLQLTQAISNPAHTSYRLREENSGKKPIDLAPGQINIFSNKDIQQGFLLDVRNQKFFGYPEYIAIQREPYSKFVNFSTSFCDSLKLIQQATFSVIILDEKFNNPGNLQYHQSILSAKYALMLNGDTNALQLQPDITSKGNFVVQSVKSVEDTRFIIPYYCNLNNVCVYVQLRDKYNWILLKKFEEIANKILEDTIPNQIDFILNAIKLYLSNGYDIISKEKFYRDIKANFEEQHIAEIRKEENRDKLLENITDDTMIINVLNQELEIHQLADIVSDIDWKMAEERKRIQKQRQKILDLAEESKINVDQLTKAPVGSLNTDAKNIGDVVKIKGGYLGVIKFHRRTGFSGDKKIYGIELDKRSPNGNNGTIKGVKYFNVNDGFGYFATETELSDINAIQQKKNINAEENMMQIKIGDHVKLLNGNGGIVKYKGKVDSDEEVMIGVELDQWSPNASNGTVRGHSYFECKEGHGYFVKAGFGDETHDEIMKFDQALADYFKNKGRSDLEEETKYIVAAADFIENVNLSVAKTAVVKAPFKVDLSIAVKSVSKVNKDEQEFQNDVDSDDDDDDDQYNQKEVIDRFYRELMQFTEK